MSDSKTDVRLSFTPVRSEFVIESEIENFRQRLVGAESGKAKANTILSPRCPVKFRGRSSQADNLEVDLRFAFVNVVSFGPVNSSTLRVTMNAYNVSDTPIFAEVIHEILKVDKTIAQITTSHEIYSCEGTTKLSESDENANETTFKRDDVMEAISDSDILNIRSTIKIYTDDVSETKEDEENLIKTRVETDRMRSSLAEKLLDRHLVDKFANFTLISVGGSKIRCFESVLAAQSPILRALLSDYHSVEAEKRELHLDFGDYTVRAFNHFLVADSLTTDLNILINDLECVDDETPEEVVRNLLILGNTYDVKNLVRDAENRLIDGLAESDFFDILETISVADKVESERLLDECINYIVKNRRKMKISVGAIRESGLSIDIVSRILETLW